MEEECVVALSVGGRRAKNRLLNSKSGLEVRGS